MSMTTRTKGAGQNDNKNKNTNNPPTNSVKCKSVESSGVTVTAQIDVKKATLVQKSPREKSPVLTPTGATSEAVEIAENAGRLSDEEMNGDTTKKRK
eukprot:9684853-Ditylum_brightwellii.AAC.1